MKLTGEITLDIKAKYILIPTFSLLIFFCSPNAFAESDLEAELFGEPSSEETSFGENSSASGSVNFSEPNESQSQEDALFGGESEDELFGGSSSNNNSQLSSRSLKELLKDKLDEKESQFYIGGKYYHSIDFTAVDTQKARDTGLSSDGVADIYFDAALDDGVRFFMKAKVQSQFTSASNDETVVDFSGTAGSNSLDQMWLKFDYQNQIYVTLGKQPTSWGSGFVWAPTDFINEETESPFALSDQRLGVSLIKIQYPLDTQGINLYGVLQTNEASTIGEVKSLFRAEKILEQSELALSISSQAHEELKLGFDFSTGLKWFDWYVNAAVTKHDQGNYYRRPEGASDPTSDDYLALIQAGLVADPDAIPANTQLILESRENEIIKQVSTGIIYIDSFDDGSQFIINSEFFYNEKGYDDSDFLTIFLLQNPAEFDPLYFGKRYAAIGFTRAGIGNSSQSYGVNYIKNLSDSSGSVILSYGFVPFNDLSFSSNLIIFTGGAGTFNPFSADNDVLQETAQRVADGELVIPENVQQNIPVFLQQQNTDPITLTVGETSFQPPRYLIRTQFSLRF
jgi:hypothetical protein